MSNARNIIHKELAAGRWREMSLLAQMANIGSEVSRALNWRTKGNAEYSRKAADRALELLDLTLASKYSFAQYKEITRAREVVADYFYGENIFGSTEISLRKYFDGFALALKR